MRLALVAALLLTLFPGPALCQPDKTWDQDVASKMDFFMAHHEGQIEPPVVGDLRMPKRLWWMTQVAAECAGCDPVLLACMMRFESDFRCGPIGHGTYIGPMGIIYTYEDKYPIHDVFGNILTAARRLAQFNGKGTMAALRGYNKDRSSAFGRYCRAVTGETRRLKTNYENFSNSWAWRSAVDLGKRALLDLEVKAAAYTCRRH